MEAVASGGNLSSGSPSRQPYGVAEVADKRRPLPSRFNAMISAATDTAVSLGCAGAEVEADWRCQPRQFSIADTALAKPHEPIFVGAAGAHHTDVAGVGTQRQVPAAGRRWGLVLWHSQ